MFLQLHTATANGLNYVYGSVFKRCCGSESSLRASRGKLQDTRCSTSLLGKVNNASVAFNKRCTDS